jgi:hypothetical protein
MLAPEDKYISETIRKVIDGTKLKDSEKTLPH